MTHLSSDEEKCDHRKNARLLPSVASTGTTPSIREDTVLRGEGRTSSGPAALGDDDGSGGGERCGGCEELERRRGPRGRASRGSSAAQVDDVEPNDRGDRTGSVVAVEGRGAARGLGRSPGRPREAELRGRAQRRVVEDGHAAAGAVGVDQIERRGSIVAVTVPERVAHRARELVEVGAARGRRDDGVAERDVEAVVVLLLVRVEGVRVLERRGRDGAVDRGAARQNRARLLEVVEVRDWRTRFFDDARRRRRHAVPAAPRAADTVGLVVAERARDGSVVVVVDRVVERPRRQEGRAPQVRAVPAAGRLPRRDLLRPRHLRARAGLPLRRRGAAAAAQRRRRGRVDDGDRPEGGQPPHRNGRAARRRPDAPRRAQARRADRHPRAVAQAQGRRQAHVPRPRRRPVLPPGAALDETRPHG
mmetsp:Transcript_26187/g.104737  ORF Transcript_26187/g.104737 Transcript_26187/m.104737 type:complete len:419 (+) Transcript_26187:326-1582(+)